MGLEFEVVDIEKPVDTNIIIGQAHFIKTTEDVYEALITSVPNIKFGFAFCESSGKRLIRVEGNNEELKRIATENALKIGAGHSFVLLIRNAWPINVLNTLKLVQEITTVYCATANPVQVIIARTDKGRAIVGVVDGEPPLGVEKEEDIRERREFLRKIGYKLS